MHSDHWFIIVNPMAGGSRLKSVWPQMKEKLIDSGLVFTADFTKSKGHASELVQAALKEGYRRIVGVGGDGTNNEIINGILNQNHTGIDTICYTLMPFGTGNDWSRTHKIPRKVNQWVKMLKANHQIDHNIGLLELENNGNVQKRFFINVAGMAYDAHIVKMGEKYPMKSRRKYLYLWLVLRWLWNYSSPPLKVKFKNETRTNKFYTINCGICNYAGGGMKIVPHANPKGKEFGVTLIRDFPKWQVPFDTPKLFTGKLKNHKYTEMVSCNKIEISATGDELLEVETDGEFIGSGKVNISLHSQTLKVLVPKKD